MIVREMKVLVIILMLLIGGSIAAQDEREGVWLNNEFVPCPAEYQDNIASILAHCVETTGIYYQQQFYPCPTAINDLGPLEAIRACVFGDQQAEAVISAPVDTAPQVMTEAVMVLYTVERGDNLTRIADRFGVELDALIQANHLENPNVIHAGNVLVIPG